MKQKTATSTSRGTTDETVTNKAQMRRKMLEVTFAQIDKQWGNGAVMFLGQTPQTAIDVISTGSLLIDQAIGVGGFPCGRITEIYGPESSGKTTLALHVVAQAQKKGGTCAFIDAEHALDQAHVRKLGVNIDDLIISQPDYGEQALEIAEALVRSGAVDLIVIDSVAALVPKAELEGDMGDAHVGLQARLMSQALRKLTPVVHKSKTVLIFINQVRQTIGGMPYAPKETTTGGKALKFYASLRIEVRRVASLKKKEVIVGNRISVNIKKNKVAPPFKKVEVDLLFDQGISPELDLLDAAVHYGVIVQSGSWFSFEDTKIAQGREQVIEYLKNNPEVMKNAHACVLNAMAAHDDRALSAVAVDSAEDDEAGMANE
jgi:recombination protein RecA